MQDKFPTSIHQDTFVQASKVTANTDILFSKTILCSFIFSVQKSMF